MTEAGRTARQDANEQWALISTTENLWSSSPQIQQQLWAALTEEWAAFPQCCCPWRGVLVPQSMQMAHSLWTVFFHTCSYVTSAKYGAYIFWLFLSFFVHLVIIKLGYPLKANEKQYMSGHLHTTQTTPANLQRNAVVWCKIPWVYMKYTPVL